MLLQQKAWTILVMGLLTTLFAVLLDPSRSALPVQRGVAAGSVAKPLRRGSASPS